MPNFDAWLGTGTPIDTSSRAEQAWQRIQDRPTSIVIVRDGTDRPAQTVRVEVSLGRMVEGETGMVPTQQAVIYGVRGHGTIADTDIRKFDRFYLASEKRWYNIQTLVLVPGEIQGMAEVEALGL